MNVLAAGAIIFDAIKEKNTCIGRKNRTSRGQGKKQFRAKRSHGEGVGS
jgi:hypothetical protein